MEVLLRMESTAYDLTFHPRLQGKRAFCTSATMAFGPAAKSRRATRVTRYTMSREPPFTVDPKSALVIIEWPSDGHNGGAVAFGKDGMLYVTSGDGTSDSDTDLRGQDLGRLTAKVLRIDVDRVQVDQVDQALLRAR